MSYTELKCFHVTCDYGYGDARCRASIDVFAENRFDPLAEVLEANRWQRINGFREHCPAHRED